MGALGLPIIAYAHPLNVGLQRLSRLWDRGGDVSHFDPLLEFALSKGLPSRSLNLRQNTWQSSQETLSTGR